MSGVNGPVLDNHNRAHSLLRDPSIRPTPYLEGSEANLLFQKKPVRAGWSRHLAPVRATPRAEVDVIGVQRYQIAMAIFP